MAGKQPDLQPSGMKLESSHMRIKANKTSTYTVIYSTIIFKENHLSTSGEKKTAILNEYFIVVRLRFQEEKFN